MHPVGKQGTRSNEMQIEDNPAKSGDWMSFRLLRTTSAFFLVLLPPLFTAGLYAQAPPDGGTGPAVAGL